MVGWFEVLTTAFLLQLLALPGEKGQLVIASLATKYSPYVVVAGAATAFGGWTALEIALGNALEGSLPEVVLDGITAGLFVIFAVWILWARDPGDERQGTNSVTELGLDGPDASNPEGSPDAPNSRDSPDSSSREAGEQRLLTNGSTAGHGALTRTRSARFAGFVPSFSLMVFGEFGDKTQLITIGLAVQYGAHPAIWLGEMLAIVPVSLATALFFSHVSSYVDSNRLYYGAAALFLLFALDIVAKYLLGINFLPF